ncbi:hypothetical protein OB69_10030 [Roseivirga seohaensis subsp. aquiponti]|uniref:Uncharacterized protein n=1 Tax=Roseivirga seohaensis subsp. aquiponti TaxID=1566026 RepID=A0A0L8AKA1_9BACT|nr:hypothetical protein OB69_10030 [Roseivirga seohaensis subsp. aquiponti]
MENIKTTDFSPTKVTVIKNNILNKFLFQNIISSLSINPSSFRIFHGLILFVQTLKFLKFELISP